jgi:methionine-rich copper-binding protein CopC
MSNLFRATGIAAVVALGLTAPAFAHARLKSAYPAANCLVTTAPTELDLTFTEGVNLKFTGVKLTGPDKNAVAIGDGMLMGGTAMFMVPISGTLAAGIYTVDWHALSTDGHKTSGTYTFTVKP